MYPAIRLTFDSTDETLLDRVLAELDAFGPTAVEEQDEGLRAFFSQPAARASALELFKTMDSVTCAEENVPDEDWAEKSQAALTPVTVGSLTISPPWAATDDLREEAPGFVVVIQPSMGFGTGHHASTRLCLRLLQEIDLHGKSVLDIGTGSGVLAICAKTLGAARVVAIDVDPDALENARENLALNGLENAVELQNIDIASARGISGAPFDVVLANLTGGMLEREVDGITSLACAAGRLIMSGFQEHEQQALVARYQEAYWARFKTLTEDTWVGAIATRSRA